jgi:uncharacterized protein
MQDLAGRRQEHCKQLEEELHRLTKELRALGASRIILFGSMVQGQVNLLSDIDLIVVIDTPLDFLPRMRWIHEELQPYCADILVYTPEEFDEMSLTSPLVRHAVATGEVLHAASK